MIYSIDNRTTPNPMLLDRLIGDVVLIIHRYIHKYHVEQLIKEYNHIMKQHWDEFYCYFSDVHDNVIILNYRDLNSGVLTEWGNQIYAFNNVERDYRLPDNYVYSGIWYPSTTTHERVRN